MTQVSKKRAILEHGYNVRDGGASSIDRIIPALKLLGYEVIETNRGWRGLLDVRFNSRKRVEKLAALIRQGDLLIGHSDGCNLINRATQHLSGLGGGRVNVIYFNPALDVDTPLAGVVDRALVFHTPSDWLVGLASLLWFHDWGSMGRDGFTPRTALEDDPRYLSVAYEQIGIHRPGHSGVFKQSEHVALAMGTVSNWLEKLC